MVKSKKQQETLDEYLKHVMRERGLSRTAFAKGIGVARSTFNSYLDGHKPSIEGCRKLADFLNVPIENIFSMVYKDIEAAEILSIVEMYRALPKGMRRFVVDIIRTVYRRYETYGVVEEEKEIDG